MSAAFEQLGPYKLGKKLGQGGMGAVYEGTDIETGQTVAVKVLSPALAAEEGFRARFEAEIESLKKLKHPNIVRLFGYGEEQGSMFYAMERVDGTSLEDEIRHGRRFDWREVTQIAVKMCRALKLAHDHGIIHRDIKPANILMTREGEVKLSDFGIARLFGNTRMTSDGGVLGTAEYMAPEQADGRPVNDRCDQYSLGGVMYALLAGRPPFRASSFVEMLQMQRFSEPQPVRRYAPDTPAELDRVIAQLLEKDPAKRFVNTMMLAKTLEAMEKGLSITSARADFILADPQRTVQPHLTGLDPFAATLVPGESAADQEGYAIAEPSAGTQIHAGSTLAAASAASKVAGEARFTKVREGDEHRTASFKELLQTAATPQSLTLLLGLLIVLGTGWYFLKPLTADELYAKVKAETGDGGIDALRQAEPRMNDFLNRFPLDSRSAEIEELKSQVVLARQARNAKLRARSLEKDRRLSPIESAYVEAINMAVFDPQRTIAKLQAIVDLYGNANLSNEDGAEFVEVARTDLAKLRDQLSSSVSHQCKLLESQLKRAKQLKAEDPEVARQICKSIILLYEDKSWAVDIVLQARRLLAEMPGSG